MTAGIPHSRGWLDSDCIREIEHAQVGRATFGPGGSKDWVVPFTTACFALPWDNSVL